MKANDLHNFHFEMEGSGCYRVTFTTERRGDYWCALVHDMTVIDRTKNAKWARAKDIEHLRDMVKRDGTHYTYYGKRLS